MIKHRSKTVQSRANLFGIFPEVSPIFRLVRVDGLGRHLVARGSEQTVSRTDEGDGGGGRTGDPRKEWLSLSHVAWL